VMWVGIWLDLVCVIFNGGYESQYYRTYLKLVFSPGEFVS